MARLLGFFIVTPDSPCWTHFDRGGPTWDTTDEGTCWTLREPRPCCAPDAPPGTLQVVSWIVPRDHDLCWAHRHETSQSMYVELWRSKPLRRALTEWLADDARQAETAKGVG